ncbi:putative protein OS=Tsukamurella paurometabola (strain ATCC 8368 / DSM / CCUG 35730 /CIP 100753 / JCM 10117 / KCTC 9821 / NBRC 16120 / NCIMB 702349/ NCTC 13040) OX=521096 GN=Tpau_0128 PE=4 SV=1 [Tsukamurella paurometabola]|uniref:Uncharacterized protein n=1 Tax=Tsukamurella paurometabola (strain ATCC 8368 / DSM 20162 / CCUG 35730 / CIP 100753 / JCM 10117 / KCTC 9821 / NBRC 16120 / NCIMB 702349 / NCTC 13040) TaxID=521096 RepID=D5UQ14_TSUPD|nr:hypothetical protein [Tsukamurella paurometabola]ADG76782.1 hypothetical protein Tpau_0128 [Tsukamurella paurometabola DSM 20162]SUP41609.1 Uncharacterised protein [Tsukamurella paurometabola]
MTEFSVGVREASPQAGRATRLRTLVGGRQTRTDVVVAITLLAISIGATITNLYLTVQALPSFRECAAMACTYGSHFDVFAITFVVSLLVGTTFGAHAVLNLLNRRNAWGYALLDAIISVGSLLAGLLWVSAV